MKTALWRRVALRFAPLIASTLTMNVRPVGQVERPDTFGAAVVRGAQEEDSVRAPESSSLRTSALVRGEGAELEREVEGAQKKPGQSP